MNVMVGICYYFEWDNWWFVDNFGFVFFYIILCSLFLNVEIILIDYFYIIQDWEDIFGVQGYNVRYCIVLIVFWMVEQGLIQSEYIMENLFFCNMLEWQV